MGKILPRPKETALMEAARQSIICRKDACLSDDASFLIEIVAVGGSSGEHGSYDTPILSKKQEKIDLTKI